MWPVRKKILRVKAKVFGVEESDSEEDGEIDLTVILRLFIMCHLMDQTVFKRVVSSQEEVNKWRRLHTLSV